MIHLGGGRSLPLELTTDPRMQRRVRRLTVVSLVALGAIAALAALDGASWFITGLLVAGWVLMPSVLAWSLARPLARYLLVVPATLVSVALLTLSFGWAQGVSGIQVGWLLVTAGVLLGGTLGLWTWYRVLPVPPALDDPVAPGRWALIGVHVSLVLLGLVTLVAWPG